MFKRTAPFILAFLFLSPAAVADPHLADPAGATQNDDSVSAKQRIEILLSAHCSFPTKAELLEVSPDAVALLVELYQDPDSIPSLRNRAVDALGYFATDDTARFFEAVLSDNTTPRRALHHAISSYSRAFGERALSATASFLANDDVQLRLTAVEAIRAHGGVDGRELLQHRIDLERDLIVREKLSNAVR